MLLSGYQTLEENKSSKKYNSPKPFIEYLSTILDLSDNEREKIFFAQFVDR